MRIECLTEGPKHHFFGFHDLVCTDYENRYMLCLEVDRINSPPVPGEVARVGLVDLSDNSLHLLAETDAYNFPQGARQQWIPGTNEIVYNVSAGSRWGAVRMSIDGERIFEYEQAIYAISPNGKYGLGLDFARLHRLGGYGYVGLKCVNSGSSGFDGLSLVNMESGSVQVLVSLDDVIAFGELPDVDRSLHFVTHAVWSPDGSRIAFLHRYWLPDGGQMTRFMCIEADGTGLKLLAQGAFSHFDWISSKRLIIWGRRSSAVDKMRSATGVVSSIATPALKIARKFKRAVLSKGVRAGTQSYFIISVDADEFRPIGKNILLIDGHPMVNREYNKWLVTDTYPDKGGWRDLILFDIDKECRVDVGRFRKLDESPVLDSLADAQVDFHEDVLRKFDSDIFAFTRSGLHCDLHPRWFSNYKCVAFDSIHAGSRQVYKVDVTSIVG